MPPAPALAGGGAGGGRWSGGCRVGGAPPPGGAGGAPDVVIHTQALSDVDRCEREPQLAFQMNVQTTANLVEAVRGTKALLVYLSTDYVFDGRKGSAYVEADPTHPISVYGRSKLDGEQVALSRDRAVVARPSTLFGAG